MIHRADDESMPDKPRLRIFNPGDDDAVFTVSITITNGLTDVSAIPCKLNEAHFGMERFVQKAIKKRDDMERSVSFLILSD